MNSTYNPIDSVSSDPSPKRHFSVSKLVIGAVLTVAAVAFVTVRYAGTRTATSATPLTSRVPSAIDRNAMHAAMPYGMNVHNRMMPQGGAGYVRYAGNVGRQMPTMHFPVPGVKEMQPASAMNFGAPTSRVMPGNRFANYYMPAKAAAPAAAPKVMTASGMSANRFANFRMQAKAAAPAAAPKVMTASEMYANRFANSPIQAKAAAPATAAKVTDAYRGRLVIADSNACATTPYGVCTGTVPEASSVIIRQCTDGMAASACRCFSTGGTVVSAYLDSGRCYCNITTDDPGSASWSMYLFCK